MRRYLTATLLLLLAAPVCWPAAPPDPVSQAVRRGLWRLEQGATSYTQHRQCFSCHHQAVTLAAFAAARQRGFAVPRAFLEEQTAFTLDSFRNRLDQVRKGQNVGGRNTTVAYALFTLQAIGHRADETTAALVDFLLVGQGRDGSWAAQMPRLPSEGSRFTNAALALAALRHYGDATRGARHERIEAASRKGRDWLLRGKPADTEDRVFRIRGLVTAGADPERIRAARDELVGQQQPDGSWAQLPTRSGDAYATGSVMAALRVAGMSPVDVPYRRGVGYLLRTQRPDGAWIVRTRSKPIQKFFDNGDPGGESQFISFLATGWATLALVEAIPAR